MPLFFHQWILQTFDNHVPLEIQGVQPFICNGLIACWPEESYPGHSNQAQGGVVHHMDKSLRPNLSAWLVYNWETKARKWYDWKEGFDKVGHFEPDEKLYYVELELDPAMQFLEPVPHTHARIQSVAYKTPTHVYNKDNWKEHLVGTFASLITHAIPLDVYGPNNPLYTSYVAPNLVVMRISNTSITIRVDVQTRDAALHLLPVADDAVKTARQAITDQLENLDDGTVLAMAELLKHRNTSP